MILIRGIRGQFLEAFPCGAHQDAGEYVRVKRHCGYQGDSREAIALHRRNRFPQFIDGEAVSNIQFLHPE